MPIWNSRVLNSTVLTAVERDIAIEYVLSHPDYRSYHLLFAIRRDRRTAYDAIEPTVRARVLASVLSRHVGYDDWNNLDVPLDHRRSDVVESLLETRTAAIPYLIPVLHDQERICISGSDAATFAWLVHSRRCDYAYQFITSALGRKVIWSANPDVRDREIGRLIEDLKGKY
jgi:hypothetical protein